MFVIRPEVKEKLKATFANITEQVQGLSSSAAHNKKYLPRMETICALSIEAHEMFRNERKEMHAIDPESKQMLLQLARLHNTTTSLMDTIKTGDAGTEDVRQYRTEMSTLLDNFKGQARSLEAANALKTRRLQSREGGDHNEVANDRILELQREEEHNLEKYNRFRMQMPTKDAAAMGDRKLVVFEIPVIPILQVLITPQQLKGIGISGDAIGMYNVLLKQRILAVNHTSFKRESEMDKYLDLSIKSMGERSGTKYQFVSENPIKYAPLRGLIFYWVMESSKLSRLLGLTRGPIDEWGFPFAMESRVKKVSQKDGTTKEVLVDPGPTRHAPYVPKQSTSPEGLTKREGVPRWYSALEESLEKGKNTNTVK